ncbi:Gypsy retrotransposon integrase-like protein 1 [Fusarium falciforme]|nr:Gypsy retrotransposon integrase-like protein 1 [Fusarium falciforme]
MTGASPLLAGRTQRAKRVARACDYCRRKRLKCTSNQYPCLNCQLYNAECTTRDRVRRRAAASISGADHVEAESVIQVGISAAMPREEPSIDVALDSAGGGGVQAELATSDNGHGDNGHGDNSAGDNGHGDNGHGDNVNHDDSAENQDCYSAQPWSGHGVDETSRDFGDVLRQLGIGVSSNFWDPDKATFLDIINAESNFVGDGVGGEGLGLVHMHGHDAPTAIISDAAPFASPRSRTSSGNGKVSDIGSLTAREVRSGNSEETLPSGVFIRKNETLTNYIGMLSISSRLRLMLTDLDVIEQVRLL